MEIGRLNVMTWIGNWALKQVLLVSFCCFTWLGKIHAQTLPAPTWGCIQTVGSDVVLTWNSVNDPGNNFVSYDVYSNQDGFITSINNINTTSYTDVNVSSIKDYYIKVVDNTGNTDGVIFQNIRLNLTNPSDGTAILSWNTPSLNVSNPASNNVYILREYPAGTWTSIDTVSFGTTFYKDTIDICSAFLNYQVVYPGDGCNTTSNVRGDDFEDKITPAMPVITNVTIDTLTHDVSINWNKNSQSDTYGYVIYKMDGGGILVPIDTVYGWGTTSFTYTEITSDEALTYSVAAFDSCFTQSLPQTYQTSAKSATHTSIFLRGEFNQCQSNVELKWSAYQGWTGALTYEVYATDINNNWQLQTTTNGLAYNVSIPATGTYQFVIKGRNTDSVISFSNIVELNLTTSGAPLVHYFVSASVEEDRVKLTTLTDPNSNVAFIAYDRMDNNGNFNEIGRQAVNGNFMVVFEDKDVNVDKVNRYRAIIVDSCGNRTRISDTVSTIYLQVSSDEASYSCSLNWTPYVGFDGGVESYSVYRGADGIWESTPIAVLGPNDFTYQEGLEELSAKKEMCYRIEATEKMNSYGFHASANSNKGCASFEPSIFIPNAFKPEGVNKTFKPVFAYMNLPIYEMRIYNRWAELVHLSDTSTDGWDGKILDSGEFAQPGVYLYRIMFKDIEGAEILKEGWVTLLR